MMIIIHIIISINLIFIIIISVFIYELNGVIDSLTDKVSKWLKLGHNKLKKRQENPKNFSGLQFLSWLTVKGFGTSLS